MTQALTSHNSTNEYSKRFKLKESENCVNCTGTVDDTKHRSENCTKYENQRENFIKDLEAIGKRWPIDIKVLISNENTYSLFKTFLKEIFT